VEKKDQLILHALWTKSGGVEEEISSLREQEKVLYAICQNLRASRNLDDQEKLRKKEKEFWNMQEDIRRLVGKRDTLLDACTEFEETGVVNERLAQTLIPEYFANNKGEEQRLSKRKLAILRETEREERLGRPGQEPSWVDCPLWPFAGINSKPQTRILTTGRRATHITGSFSSLDAERKFYECTADTHGGKVRGGSKGKHGFKPGKGGKGIRKH
jgi:hypothetical protein